jgi:hypothetical protein
MWFDRKPRREVTEEAQHWPTERMIAEAHADYATPADLEPMDDDTLLLIAEVESYAPDECIPCLAAVTVLERQKERLEALNPPEYEPLVLADTSDEEIQRGQDALDESHPGLRHEMMAALDATDDTTPVAERFARQVRHLNDLVEALLEGPPIPPPGVSLEDLSLLVVASQRWIAMTEAQGVDLSPGQQQVLDATKTVVARLHHG